MSDLANDLRQWLGRQESPCTQRAQRANCHPCDNTRYTIRELELISDCSEKAREIIDQAKSVFREWGPVEVVEVKDGRKTRAQTCAIAQCCDNAARK